MAREVRMHSEEGLEEYLPRIAGSHRLSDTRDIGSLRQHRAETAIMTALHEAADRSAVAMAVLEGPAHVIRYANAAFGVLTGAEGTRMLGTALSELMPPVGAAVLEVVARVRAEQRPQADVHIACVVPEPMGRAAGWHVTVWPVAETHGASDGAPDYLAMQLRDVTADVEERQRQASLLVDLQEVNERLVLSSLHEQSLREQAQAATDAKAAFLATMSHELRTPLTAIIGYEELLSDGITGPVTEAQRVQLARIKSCSDHLLALIDEVLTLARIEARQEMVHLETVRVADLVEMTTALISPMATAKRLTLTVESVRPGEDAAPETIHTDPLKVRQILLNLLNNAVKYSDRGSIVLTPSQRGEAIVFEIRDTGIGIPPAHLEHIFDAFWQVRQTATRIVEGAGLGLSVSRQLARMLGGTVIVESVVGQGSTFTLSLPMNSTVAVDQRQSAT